MTVIECYKLVELNCGIFGSRYLFCVVVSNQIRKKKKKKKGKKKKEKKKKKKKNSNIDPVMNYSMNILDWDYNIII